MKDIASCREFLEKRRRMIRWGARNSLLLMNCTNADSHSEDVSSEVTRRVIKHWDGFDSPEHVLFTIIANAARDHIRLCLAEVAQDIDDSATPCFGVPGYDPEEKVFELLLTQELLRRLNPIESYIIQLWLEGHSFEEIGKRLGMPSASVRSIKWRAVRRMRKIAV